MSDNFSEIAINDINTLCVSVIGVKNSGEAFRKLESKLSTLKGRKFYGVLNGSPEKGICRACMVLQKGDDYKGLENYTIPGGIYAKIKIEDWEKDTSLIGETFSRMSKDFKVDIKRPYIEFYKSQEELILFLPIV